MKIFYILLSVLILASGCSGKGDHKAGDDAKPMATDVVKKHRVNEKEFLKAASYEPAYKVSQYLRDGADIETKNENGQTALELALIYNKDPQVTELLIGMGADINTRDESGATILINTASSIDSDRKIRALLSAGADPNAADDNGRTAIISAAPTNTSVGVFLELIGGGADLNAKTKDGWTPLDYAARFNRNPDVIKALLKYGAHPENKAKAKEIADAIKANPALAGKGFEKQILSSI